MRLYEMDNQLYRILMLDTEQGVDTETGEILTKEMIDELQMERNQKIENCFIFLKNTYADMTAIKAEIDNLMARYKKLERKADWMEDYVGQSLEHKPFTTSKVAAKWRKSEAVEVSDLNQIDKAYLKEKTTITPDKVKIKAALKAGVALNGCQLVEHVNLQLA